MDETRNRHMPRARQEELLVHELADEVLVYDLKRKKAHCLNKTAALVWNRCDGQTSVAEMSRILEQENGALTDEGVIQLALQQLSRANLLGDAAAFQGENSNISRRQLIRTLGWSAAAALPVISSVFAPTAQAQASCRPNGAACTTNTQCCSNKCCAGSNVCAANQASCP